MKNRENIESLYSLYEFEKDKQYEQCDIYVYEQGYFNNAEIIVFDLSKKDEIEKIKNDYISMGYSVSVREADGYSEIRSKLFHGFFKTEASNRRIIKEYEEYSNLQTKRLGGNKYSYIESQYMLNGFLEENHIIERIFGLLSDEGAQLVILEAPAGFGKTCTSYEIVKLFAQRCSEQVPILAELSKNRSARIFSYVLLTEIDRKFPRLSSSLVTQQIKEGNVPLIIDGFDELLSKSSVENEGAVEEAKTMLDTIANLFVEGSNAKILLTSRKSSIFTGDIFDNWIADKLLYCNVNRMQILNPTISDWIGFDKKNLLESKGIVLDNISNPVLLSMLKNIEIETFDQRFKESSDILENYFYILLDRERDRQQLLMSVDEQRDIMRKLAAMLVQLDISSDEIDGIQALVEEIVKPDIDKFMLLYTNYSANVAEIMIPTEEEFIMKIVHNALLDRINVYSNNIGFINEFIYGILIGDAILQGDLEIGDVSNKYLNFAITSYTVECAEKREKLYHIISSAKEDMKTDEKLLIDMKLVQKMKHDFVDEYISDMIFESTFVMITQHYFYNCIFSSCTFERNNIESNLFEGCHFIDCTFYDVKVNVTSEVEEESTFISCSGHEILQEVITASTMKKGVEAEKDERYYERLVLEQYWMIGSNSAEPRKTYRTLFKGVKTQEKANVLRAIEELISRDVLRRLNYCIEINFSKLAEIREILGR